MGSIKKSRKYSIIAATCYAAFSVLTAIMTIMCVAYGWKYDFFEAIEIVIETLTLAGLAITVFTENRIAVAVALGVYTSIIRMYYIIAYFDLTNLLMFIACAVVLVTVIMAIQKKEIMNKIWFIGGSVMLLSSIIKLIELAEIDYFEGIKYFIEDGYFGLMFIADISVIFSYVLEVVGLSFIGLWLKESEFPSTTTSANANNCNAVNANNSNAVNAAPIAAPIDFGAVSGADKLKMYKDLLDYGAITQEEFNAKKKEILEK